MGESINHIKLVEIVHETAKEIIPDIYWKFIQLDAPESSNTPPILYQKHRPDLFFNYKKLMVIGEAKTGYDIERNHSQNQYNCYMRTCCNFNGEAIFILGVPWNEFPSAKNLLRKIKKQNDFSCNIKIVNDCRYIGIL